VTATTAAESAPTEWVQHVTGPIRRILNDEEWMMALVFVTGSSSGLGVDQPTDFR
jgi:hypothetical protein